MRRLGEKLATIFAWMIRCTPYGAVRLCALCLGWTWFQIFRIRRSVAIDNMLRSLRCERETAQHTTRLMYQHLTLSIFELFRHGTAHGLKFSPRVVGRDIIEQAIARGRGVILVTAHLGNWELLVRYGSTLPRRLTIVTGRMSSGFFDGIWGSLRVGGPCFVSAEGSGRNLRRRLLDNELVGFVLDQHQPGSRAVRAPFIGRVAATNSNLARLALLTGATIVPVFIHRNDDFGHTVIFQEPIDHALYKDKMQAKQSITVACLSRIEDAIRRRPEQWLWIHRRWKVDVEDKSPV